MKQIRSREINPNDTLLADPNWLSTAERNPMVLTFRRTEGATCKECKHHSLRKCAMASGEWKRYSYPDDFHACGMFELDPSKVKRKRNFL